MSYKELQNGAHELVCGTCCYGSRQMNRCITLSAQKYLSVKQHGYFMARRRNKMGFWLIQRGSFRDLKKEYKGLTGSDGLVDLDYMGSAEFERDAIPRAYRRIMGNRDKYIFHYCTDIKDYRGKILVVFCKKECVEKIEMEMKKYIEEHYRLKEFSTIHGHIKGDTWSVKQDFFWCIDQSETGDWMGWFGMDKLTPFKNMLDKDYNEWWMKKDESERQKEYAASFR